MTFLQEVLDEAREDLKDPKALRDKPPDRGLLDIQEVLEARARRLGIIADLRRPGWALLLSGTTDKNGF
jgi:hypothetical protein